MISTSADLKQVPNRRLFGTAAAAKYLGVHPNTLRKYSDLGYLQALEIAGRRVFDLVELDRFISSLPGYNGNGERPGNPKEM